MINMLPNEQLRRERQRRGWSRQYVAEQIGVADPKTIGRWERGVAFPSAYFLHRLCALYGMFAQDLGLVPSEHKNALSSNEGGAEVQVFTITALKRSPAMHNNSFAHEFGQQHRQISDGILRAGLGLRPNIADLLCRWGSLLDMPDAADMQGRQSQNGL
jgi:transcriptional regulator with XRE-family HTH domain